MAFWDSSAIVPLCRSQASTKRGRQLLRDRGRMTVSEQPRDQTFVCFDNRLSLSARRAVFHVSGF